MFSLTKKEFKTAQTTSNVKARMNFIRNTYLHLAGAIFTFILVEGAILNSALAPRLTQLMLGTNYSWLIVLALFMGVSFWADRLAHSTSNPRSCYLGLAIYIVAEAIIFVPLLHYAAEFFPNVIAQSAIITATLVLAITLVAFITKKNFSFLRGFLSIAIMVAFGLIICSILFGFTLGIVFISAMILIAGAYILYTTSNIIHEYETNQHIAASLALFASIMLMYYYVVLFLLNRSE